MLNFGAPFCTLCVLLRQGSHPWRKQLCVPLPARAFRDGDRTTSIRRSVVCASPTIVSCRAPLHYHVGTANRLCPPLTSQVLRHILKVRNPIVQIVHHPHVCMEVGVGR